MPMAAYTNELQTSWQCKRARAHEKGLTMFGRSYQQTIRQVTPPVSLESGRLDPASLRIIILTGGSLLGVGVVLIFVSMLTLPSSEYETIGRVRAFVAYASVALGGLLSFIGVHAILLPFRRERAHERRVQEWHEQTLEERRDQGGVEITQEVSEWEIRPDLPGHVLLAGLAIQLRLSQNTGRLPYSTRSLEEGLFVGNKNHLVKVAEASPATAERLARRFADVGWLQGRDGATRSPGQWVPQSVPEMVELFARNWHRAS